VDPSYGYQAPNGEAQEQQRRLAVALDQADDRDQEAASGLRAGRLRGAELLQPECMGGVVFPSIGELTYLLTLPGHGFYWFLLPPAAPQR
jgi:hypothetical protein